MEIIDSSIGMMYGTLLGPILLGCGFGPHLVVPGILLSQALGGIGGTVSHQWFKNADFKGMTKDTKVIVLSAYLDEEAFKQMKEYGADACFSKPLPLDQLKSEVAGLLGLK